jgi:transposase
MSPDTDTTQASWELPEAVWQRMELLLPPRQSTEGHPRTVDLKRITEGIFSVLRTGIQWQACPRERFGPPARCTPPSGNGSQQGCVGTCGPWR